MRVKVLLLLLCAWSAWAQQKQPVTSLQEDCGVIFSFTSASSGAQASGTVQSGSTGTTAVIDNRTAGCIDWVVSYNTTSNVTGLSLDFQTADNVAGNPSNWSDYGGTLTTGINPNTAATTPWAITQASGTEYAFLRMNLLSLTGAGTVSGTLKGWKRRPPAGGGGGGGSGCVGTSGTPCRVAGPNANGTAPTAPPVLMAGWDNGALVRTLITGSAGQLIVIPDYQTSTLGSYSANFGCDQSVYFDTSTSGEQQIIAGVGGKDVYICHYEIATVAPEDFSMDYGTGSNCGTGTQIMSKALQAVNATEDYVAPNALRNFPNLTPGGGNAVCFNQSAAQHAVVTVVYAQF